MAPPPDASHEAIHLCGKKRCLNPDHLAWGTKLTNKSLSPNQLFKSSNLVKRARKPESVAVTTGTPHPHEARGQAFEGRGARHCVASQESAVAVS
ncbi:hypothetical protein V8C86DRAFT_3121128 [Haematococcus lacustris]